MNRVRLYCCLGTLFALFAAGCGEPGQSVITEEDTTFTDVLLGDKRVNTSPTLTLDAPEADTVFASNSDIVIAVTVSDVEDSVETLKITVTLGEEILSEGNASPDGTHQATVQIAEPGAHTLVVTVTDGTSDPTSLDLPLLINTEPGAPVVTISPATADTTDDLIATVVEDATDPDRASDKLSYTFVWTKNGETTDITNDTVPSTQTARDDVWHVEVRATDGLNEGDMVEAEITVGNALPTQPTISIDPFEATLASVLTCAILKESVDPDDISDTEVTYAFTWSLNGVLIEGAQMQTLDLVAWALGQNEAIDDVVLTAVFTADDELRCTATAQDDVGSADPVESEPVILGDVDACADATYNTCSADATCAPTSTLIPACVCNDGFDGDGTDCTNLDDCLPNPCQNESICEDLVSGFACNCAAGYEGDDCSVNVDDCAAKPCQNNALCTDAIDAVTCACVAGFEGDFCENNINDCADAPCQNGGACTDDVADYVCECALGYGGKDCETNIDDCANNPCANGATCVDGINGSTCDCTPGFAGTLCDVNVDDCAGSPCKNGGGCTDGVNAFTCTCQPGYTGNNCQTDADDCANNPCKNGGACTDAVNGFSCACAPGFSGDICLTDDDGCVPSPCKNGGTCTDGVNSSSCACKAGFVGDLCETNVNDCAPSPCKNGGTCTDGVDTFTCSCPVGYGGTVCDENINDCAGTPCQNGGECQDGVDGYTCTCSSGFVGLHCELNEDDCKPNPCLNSGTCTDAVASYSCECAAGFTGKTCDNNVDECAANPCVNGTCQDGINSYACTCEAGWKGMDCDVNIDECLQVTCIHGTCKDGLNDFTCECEPGWEGNLCSENVDECLSNACVNGVCQDGMNGYDCQCEPGWSGDLCDANVDDCAPNPCLNEGGCQDAVNGYTCSCKVGWTGKDCEENINDCALKPCQHGVCQDLVGDYLCDCDAGWDGKFCDNNIDDCLGAPCLNGGTCLDQINKYKCDCALGFQGENCEVNTNDCQPNPCFNGAKCVDKVSDFLCECLDGYTGVLCDENINECAEKPCQNDGTCTDAVNDYSCTCPPGFGGKNCEINADDCDPNPCVNGDCSDGADGYSCKCMEGWGGTNCQVNLDNCAVEPCLNGTCVDEVNAFTCVCDAGWTGVTCKDNVDECAEGLATCDDNAVCEDEIGGYSCVCQGGLVMVGATCYAAPTKEGDVIVTEFMSNPAGVSDSVGEWFEIYNTTGQELVLNGLRVLDQGSDEMVVTDEAVPLKIAPYGYFVFGKNIDPKVNGGVPVDYQMNGFGLTNSTDEIILESHQGALLDMVAYDNGSFPLKAGSSASYDPSRGQAPNANDAGDAWCPGSEPYNDVDQGSPGSFNEACDPNADCNQLGEGIWDCVCLDGYEGPAWACVDGNDCLPNPCQNQGTCKDGGAGVFLCSCMAGFTGDTCDVNINECAGKPCLNGGVCTDGVNSYTCECPAGWEGIDCDENVDDCANQPCLNGGTCTDLLNDFNCECLKGFSGKTCDLSDDPCVNIECVFGTCNESGLCDCDAGWQGNLCDVDIDECQKGGNNCSMNATCKNLQGGFQCTCFDGYQGDGVTCTLVDACENVICQNGGTCKAGNCNCPEGWAGDLCEADINECINGGNNCSMHANCKNLPGSFECYCHEGYEGDGVTCTPIVVDPCEGVVCQNGGTCKAGNCNCPPEWSGDDCGVDFNECKAGTDQCDANATCTNSIGGYACACNQGYDGDGFTCTLIVVDPCDGVVCQNGGICMAGICNCLPEWSGDDCGVDFDECKAGAYQCDVNAMCINLIGGYSCACNDGYQGDGLTCTLVDACENVICQNGGICKAGNCNCPEGWGGDLCEADINECINGNDNCSVNANCKNLPGSFECYCHQGYEGDGVTCTPIVVDPCENVVCQNGGTCLAGICSCPEGWSGDDCSVDFDECKAGADQCDANATCSNSIGGYSCECKQGYEGNGFTCTLIVVDPCEGVDCQNGGTCKAGICKCPPGWTGDLCEKEDGASNETLIEIAGFQFAPMDLNVYVGDTVTWKNLDKANHTVTSQPQKFPLNSPTLATGQTYSYTFNVPGVYSYYCAFHPQMTGTILVSDEIP